MFVGRGVKERSLGEDFGSSNFAVGSVRFEKGGGCVWWLSSHRPIDRKHGGITVGENLS